MSVMGCLITFLDIAIWEMCTLRLFFCIGSHAGSENNHHIFIYHARSVIIPLLQSCTIPSYGSNNVTFVRCVIWTELSFQPLTLCSSQKLITRTIPINHVLTLICYESVLHALITCVHLMFFFSVFSSLIFWSTFMNMNMYMLTLKLPTYCFPTRTPIRSVPGFLLVCCVESRCAIATLLYV